MDRDRMQAAAERLGAKLDALDLDADEREVLGGMLGAGASSVEPVGDEVEGFALNAYLVLDGQKQGQVRGSTARSETEPLESISLNFGRIEFVYTPQ